MVGTKTPRKSVVNHNAGRVGHKLQANLAKLKKKSTLSSSGFSSRPRRFSLIYSSDSSLSDVSEVGNRAMNLKNSAKKRKNDKVKSISNNASGKRSKLIQDHSIEEANNGDDDEGTESSDYQVIASNDSDSGSGSDSDSETTSSDDANIDFVKLTAQRKKRAMKALSALKRGKSPTKVNAEEEQKSQKQQIKQKKDTKQDISHSFSASESDSGSVSDSGSETSNVSTALAFNFRRDDDGIRFGDVSNQGSEEDIGEEVKDSNEIRIPMRSSDNLNQLHVPQFSASEESEYDIDQDAYFNIIEDEDNASVGEIDTGLETGEDEVPILHEEEQNIVTELQNDEELSFDGSIHEDGSDPAENIALSFQNGKNDMDEEEDFDEEDDEIMTVFDMPFYEDPKFASLYYCEDGSEPRLSLSTSLPLLMTDEKLTKLRKKEAKKIERKERIQRRKLLKESQKSKRSQSKTPQVDGDEYIFGVFFQSDNGENDGDHDEDGNISKHDRRALGLNKNLDLESPLRRLGSAAASDASSDDEYDNILLDIAHMPSDDDDDHAEKEKEESNETANGRGNIEEIKQHSRSSSDDSGLDLDDDDGYDDDDEDMSVTNVFIDIDDLDPDSFYFQEDEDNNSSSYSDMLTDDTDVQNNKTAFKDDLIETVVYVDDESTDEDDNLPPPSSRSKVIGSKAKEVVSANVVGLRPPKLGTWETDSKPFTIIDGLSTKSLYPLIQEHQQLLEQQKRAQSQSPDLRSAHEISSANGDELTLNELLNMSELEDDENSTPSYSQAVSDWYEKPKVPLSAFRNKGVNSHEEDEYMLPVNSTRKVPIGYIGSERTRRKIDRMKELQRKKTEKRRKLKKKKKLLKLRREKERLEKVNSSLSEKTPEVEEERVLLQAPNKDRESSQSPEYPADLKEDFVESVGLEEIHAILGKDNSDIMDGSVPLYNLDEGDVVAIDGTDADILASLTAPIQLDEFHTGPSWRRRQSMVEAAAENLRFTKNGLFSESALADIEGIIGDGKGAGAFEFNEALQ